MKDFKDLLIWQRSHQLALQIYRMTEGFPREELYGLTAQIRRSCSSVPTNIAEGCGREGGAELARFFQIAMGSASELEYQLLLARDLGFLPVADYDILVGELIEIKRMLNAFIQKLRANR
jgi:four helix bundle protein